MVASAECPQFGGQRGAGARVKSAVVLIIGVVLAAWMSAGRWLFGLGGSLTWWYVPAIGLTYVLVHMWIAHRLTVTARRGRHTGRATYVSLILSWVSAVGFGLTVPDNVNGTLVSILSSGSGSDFSIGMSIALCNPLGIVAFTIAGIAVAFAYGDARDPKPEEDEYDDSGEGPQMVPHPLA